jgi:outer membrane protein OmpA-like peptidoglycan-associated protein
LGNSGNVKVVGLPSHSAVKACIDGNVSNCVAGVVQEVEIWAWNANLAFLFGVGDALSPDGKGIQTSKGSLAEKYGVNIVVHRQDDTNIMQADLLATATQLVSDPNASGTKFVTIMGDGAAQFFQGLNPKLAKLDGCVYDMKHPDNPCPQGNGKFMTETVAITGFSYGEDGFWGPALWKNNCEAMRGGLTIGVLRDGDWNIAMKKLNQCNVPNNPDDKTYDPKAMNWVNADSYTKAAEMFITPNGFCEDLPIKGKLGGGKQHVCAQGVVTWTPGDVTIAHKCANQYCSGAVPIMTTKQSVFQMPCILVGIHAWDVAHKDDVIKILKTAFAGADQVRVNPAALVRGSEISQTLYAEVGANPQYWAKYFKGTTESDTAGVMVQLGGSRVSNLADNLQAFGLNGGPSLFAATYTTFGNIDVQQYPNLIPSYPPVSKILDTSYVVAVKESGEFETNNSEQLVKQTTAPMKTVEGQRNYQIQFASGSARILPSSFSELEQIAKDVEITNYIVAVHGYTDDAKWANLNPDASSAKNMQLSSDRADAVVAYLKTKGVPNTVRPYSHGQDEQIPGGRDVNRRVKIVVGQ